MSEASRFAELDGLRGIAAAIVASSHLIQSFAPWFVFGGATSALWINHLASSPLYALYCGPFWVYIFFALSGFVIAASADRSSANFLSLVLRRYIRLAVPVICAAVATWALYRWFPGAAKQAASIVGHFWIGQIGPEQVPPLEATIKNNLNVFWNGYTAINPALWTLRIELGGSVLIYAMYRAFPLWLRVAISLPAVIALLSVFDYQRTGGLECFLVGSLMYENAKRCLVAPHPSSWILIFLGLLVGGEPLAPCSDAVCGAASAVVDLLPFPRMAARSLGAALLFVGICLNHPCRVFLRRSAPHFLGKVSFPLYLIHMPVLGTVVAATYNKVPGYWFIPFLVGEIAILLFATSLFAQYVDQPLVRRIRWLNLGVTWRQPAEHTRKIGSAPAE